MEPATRWLTLLIAAAEIDCPATHDLVVEVAAGSDNDARILKVTRHGDSNYDVAMHVTATPAQLHIRTAIYTEDVPRRNNDRVFGSILICANRLTGDELYKPLGALYVLTSSSAESWSISVLNEYIIPIIPIDQAQPTIQEFLAQLIARLYSQAIRYQKCFVCRNISEITPLSQ